MDIKINEQRYLNVEANKPLASLYDSNAHFLGIEPTKDDELNNMYASTDMGNVSYVVPSIHPTFYMGSQAFNHTRSFTEAAGNVWLCIML